MRIKTHYVTMLLFGLLMMGMINQVSAIVVESNVKFNIAVGDSIVVLYEEFNNNTKNGDNVHFNDEKNYIRFTCNEYDQTSLENYDLIRFSEQTHTYEEDGEPDYTSSIGWIDGASNTFYVNENLTSFIEMSRFIIPNDLYGEDIMGGNLTLFFMDLISVMDTDAENPIEEMKSSYQSITIEEEVLNNITSTEDKLNGTGIWEYNIVGFNDEENNVYTIFNVKLNLIFNINIKRVVEFMDISLFFNITTFNDDIIAEQILRDMQISTTLKYDSRPNGEWNQSYTWVFIPIIVVIGGFAVFYGFFYSKCKADPMYSSACKKLFKPSDDFE